MGVAVSRNECSGRGILASVNSFTTVSGAGRDDRLGGHPEKETQMRRAITIMTVTVLIGLAIKIMVAPTKTVAGTEAAFGSIQTVMPVYDLDVRHPDMKGLPVQEAPQP